MEAHEKVVGEAAVDLAPRMRVALWLALATTIALAASEWRVESGGSSSLLFRLTQGVVVLGSLCVIRDGTSAGRLVPIGLTTLTVVLAAETAVAILEEAGGATPVVALILVMGTGALVPWGLRAQLLAALVGVSALTLQAVVLGGQGGRGPIVAALIGFGGSVAVAYQDRLPRTRAAASGEELGARETAARTRVPAGHLESARQAERESIAGQLHDEVAQSLTALGLMLGSGSGLTSAEHQEVARLVEDAMAQLRRVIQRLRPARGAL